MWSLHSRIDDITSSNGLTSLDKQRYHDMKTSLDAMLIYDAIAGHRAVGS